MAVIGLLVLHYALARASLLRENPTVDEVAHLPAGITYWQKGTFSSITTTRRSSSWSRRCRSCWRGR